MDEYSGYGLEHWRVYAPALGYCLDYDTGKYFRFETQALHYVQALRRAGHLAWYERAQ